MSIIYRIIYHGRAFGDNLFSAYVTDVLLKHGFDARLDNPQIDELVDGSKLNQGDDLSDCDIRTFNCIRRNRTGLETAEHFTVYSDLLNEFSKKFEIGHSIKNTLTHVPVKFVLDKSAPSYDIAMVTETGWWTPYRNWPYFGKLKDMLSEASISFIDLSSKKIRGNLALNIVRNCRLFVGLETGISHYVSKFANGKALILQSGYSPFSYWAGMYDYRSLSVTVPCSPCWRRSDCVGHECMALLRPELVFSSILEELKR